MIKSNFCAQRIVRRGLTLAIFLAASTALAVGTRRFSLETGDDFQGGDLKGVAVDSAGMVRPGFDLGSIPLTRATTVWDALRLADSSLLIASGNEGALLQVKGQAVAVVGETKALAATSLAALPGGAVAVGTLPDGKIFKYEGSKLSEWVKLEAEHIWALAYDEKTGSLFAATGPDGKLFRIDRAGKASVYFDADEQHLMSLAIGPDGTVYTGASDRSKLYTLTGPGRARVLYDFASTEVRAIRVAKNGEVFAIANELKVPRSAPRRPGGNDQAAPTRAAPEPSGKGVLFRFGKNGAPERLLSDDKEYFVSLGLDDGGTPYVGTANEGRIYTVDDRNNSILIADAEQRQIGALLLDGKERYALASDPGVLLPIRGLGGPNAIWTSKVLDAGLRATLGRLDWEGSGRLEFSTRTGGTEKPDATWSDWSPPITAPGLTKSPPGRYVQIRARLGNDASALLKTVELAFVTDNLRAYVTQFNSKSRASGNSKNPIEASGGPISATPSTTVDLSWKVENPDDDTLRYRLQYQPLGTDHWFELLAPQELLTKPSYNWNTQDLPEGRYRVRVTASDEPSNPPSLAKEHAAISNVILVDNTPPVVSGLAVNGRRIRGTAIDGVGPITRVEVAVSSSNRWLPFFPNDGIFDQSREDFDLDVSTLVTQVPTMLTIRVYDAANNSVLKYVTIR